jgi:hypothetical protein
MHSWSMVYGLGSFLNFKLRISFVRYTMRARIVNLTIGIGCKKKSNPEHGNTIANTKLLLKIKENTQSIDILY